MRMARLLGLIVVLSWLAETQAFAWGCDAHRAVVILAERLLGPSSVNAMQALLGAAPIDPALRRGCPSVSDDRLADEATWADDQRSVQPSTAGWHFVNFPRSIGSNTSNVAPYCRGGNCAVAAIAGEFDALSTSTDPPRRATALRFLLHLVGDIHQPLHAITNGDRGGNCLPVTFLAQTPEQDERGNFSPNLHALWDSTLVAALMKKHQLAGAGALAGYVASQGRLPKNVSPQRVTASLVTSWARGANGMARSVAYGRLPVPVPLEPITAVTLSSCEDNRDIAHRALALNERLSDSYMKAAEPVIVGQLRLAATRLAGVLKSAFP